MSIRHAERSFAPLNRVFFLCCFSRPQDAAEWPWSPLFLNVASDYAYMQRMSIDQIQRNSPPRSIRQGLSASTVWLSSAETLRYWSHNYSPHGTRDQQPTSFETQCAPANTNSINIIETRSSFSLSLRMPIGGDEKDLRKSKPKVAASAQL